jgi:transposase
MPRRATQPHLKVIPQLLQEALYLGIDVGKRKHVAVFVSNTLLKGYQRFEACLALAFENSREGFRALFDRITSYVPAEHCFAVMEKTGHYYRPLMQFLQEFAIPVYLIHVQRRAAGMLKTDKRDALILANTLYSQLELGAQVADKTQLIRRAVPPTPAAAQLRGLIRHRAELVRETTQRKNKLTAICDELFPEFTAILHDPNLPTALAFRETFPTPHALALASFSKLQAIRGATRSLSDSKLHELQRLAAQSIGTRDLVRQRSLVLEQEQLIKELRLQEAHVQQLEQVREGQILSSMGLGPIQAASIIAAIGSIENFPHAGALKSYFGWAPSREQTGTSFDRSHLTRGGSRSMRQTLFLSVAGMVRYQNSEWSKLYQRLIQTKCPTDTLTGKKKGKMRVIGRIAGQLIETMYALLKTDAEVLSQVLPGQEPPPPTLYDQEVHRCHREGHYRPVKLSPLPSRIVLLPKSP